MPFEMIGDPWMVVSHPRVVAPGSKSGGGLENGITVVAGLGGVGIVGDVNEGSSSSSQK